MDFKSQKAEVSKTLQTAKNIYVLIPQNANLDATAAALSLYLSLKESGKNVIIGSPSQMRVEFSQLVGIDKITDKTGNRNLTISFDYKEESIDKVSYNVEGDKFNLIIQPRAGFPPLDQENVNYSYEGIDAQIIFVVGAQKLESLGNLYEKDRQAFSDAQIVNIDRSSANSNFGQINIVEPKSGSISELMYSLIKSLSLTINADLAGNLLKGIEAQTQNFQSPFATVFTFETAAELMKAGAKRSLSPQRGAWGVAGQRRPFPGMKPGPAQQAPTSPSFRQDDLEASDIRTKFPAQDIRQAMTPQTFPPSQASVQSLPSSPSLKTPASQAGSMQRVTDSQYQQKPIQKKHSQRPHEYHKTKNIKSRDQSNQVSRGQQAREDWLKPKIYKGKTKV